VTPVRGEIWRYRLALARPGVSDLRLVVSAAAINDNEDLPVVLAVHVVDDDPGGLLAVRAMDGWASALTIEPVLRGRLVERLGRVDAETMDNMSAALRAAQDL
jgi:mRNA-degrading endonuclease toxin of MazEF toxin-antitoxin module